MIGTIIFILYSLVGIGLIRPLAGHFAWKKFRKDQAQYSHYSYRTEPDDWFDPYVQAICLAVVWPLAFFGVLLHRYTPALGAEKEAIDKIQRQIDDAKREEQIASIRERETELGLKHWDFDNATR